jgi:hypothetical protein
MEFDEAIEKLLDGTAIMFAGAGCSDGATNIRDKPFLKGNELAKHLAIKAGINDNTPSLDDAAEAFTEAYGESALIREIQNEFIAKVITDSQIQIGSMPWKRIYTTNYDDVIEEAYKANSKNILPITTSDNPLNVAKGQMLCVHLNGFVHKLDLNTIGTELKLTESSYLSAELADSPWATSFRHDISVALAVFFIGYSLYDLDIKRILFENPSLKDKCFFILGKSANDPTIRRAKLFGKVYKMSLGEFCNYVFRKRRTYQPVQQSGSTISIREHKTTLARMRITDQDFTNLLLFGIRNQEMMLESINSKHRYLLEREELEQVFKLLREGHRIVNICSDLGNGKSLFLDSLRIRALERGFRVFEVREHSQEAISELEVIARLKGNILVTIEEYQDWLTEIGQFKLMSGDNVNMVLTARNAINDVNVDTLLRETRLEYIPEIYLDKLEDTEIDWFIDAFDEYGLWGEMAARKRADKFQLITRRCRRQIHALLLKIMDSPDIGQRLRNLAESLKTNREKYQILIGICIMTLLNQMPGFDTLVDVFGPGALSRTRFRRDITVSHFIDFSQNEILLKSPIAAQYILQNIADPGFTISVLTDMTRRVHTSASATRRYQKMLSNFMMFSNLQLILPKDGRAAAVISYYESIKNLSRCQTSPLFWLQYAIACLVIEDLPRSKRYFETAYSYAYQQNFNTYQIDNHYARFLLVQAAKELQPEAAMENFRQARTIINQQVRDERVLHYPYRVASHYQLFLDRFSPLLNFDQLREIKNAANEVNEVLNNLSHAPKHRDIIKCGQAMRYVIDKIDELTKSESIDEDLSENQENVGN